MTDQWFDLTLKSEDDKGPRYVNVHAHGGELDFYLEGDNPCEPSIVLEREEKERLVYALVDGATWPDGWREGRLAGFMLGSAVTTIAALILWVVTL